MDLEKFLEKDIVEFLEKKDIERKQKAVVISEELEEFSTDKDYMTLFKSSLQNRDLIRAKGLFLEVQNKFANSKTEVEKEAYTGLIETMFTEMKSLDQNKETDKAFIEELSDMKIIEDKILSDGDRFKKDFNDTKEKIKSAILKLGESISEDLQKNDLVSAINKYKILKQKFAQFPDELKEEKESLFNDLITYYYQIRKLEKIKKHDKREARIESSELKKEVLTSVKEESLILIQKIQATLKEKKIGEAMKGYEQLKDIFERFPKEYTDEKKALYEHTINIYKTIKNQAETIRKNRVRDKGMQTNKATEKEEVSSEGGNATDDKSNNFIIDIKREFKEAIMLLKQRKIDEAELKLIDIKRKLNWFPKGREKDKEKFEHLTEEIEHRINFLKHQKQVM